ncbi:hypothetical protein AYY17_07470 [Morganella psychrotolerans]|uniref:Uncharacterized protein n=1 Tax=Morganella psychrotolerans TaxID=368603 RepID=A0A1B8H6M8_9GAMM|nr:hypothetical protein AYY17_07470 [Morganella psychrotolerans]
MVQIIRMEGSNAVLAWQKVSYEVSRNNYFAQLMKALKTVRNNLFHGGKECESGFEYSDRNMDLIRTGTAVINEMVASLGWSGDFSAQH